MDRAARKRKSLSEGSEPSTSSILMMTKTRRLDDSPASTVSDRVPSTTSSCRSSTVNELASSKYAHLEEEEHGNVATVEFTATSPGDSLNCSDRREASEVNSEVESTARPRQQSSFQRVQKMPSEAELEDFFAAAEKAIQMKFIDEYNFDIGKDEPLAGRYEWVQLQVKKAMIMTLKRN